MLCSTAAFVQNQTAGELRISDSDARRTSRQSVILQAPASNTLTADQTLVLPSTTLTSDSTNSSGFTKLLSASRLQIASSTAVRCTAIRDHPQLQLLLQHTASSFTQATPEFTASVASTKFMDSLYIASRIDK